MKILTNKKYSEMEDNINSYKNMYNQATESLMLDNKDYELRIQTICDMLVDIVNLPKSRTGKDTIIQKVKGVIRYIHKGE